MYPRRNRRAALQRNGAVRHRRELRGGRLVGTPASTDPAEPALRHRKLRLKADPSLEVSQNAKRRRADALHRKRYRHRVELKPSKVFGSSNPLSGGDSSISQKYGDREAGLAITTLSRSGHHRYEQGARRLVLHRQTPLAPQRPYPEKADSADMKVLVVDDDLDTCEYGPHPAADGHCGQVV